MDERSYVLLFFLLSHSFEDRRDRDGVRVAYRSDLTCPKLSILPFSHRGNMHVASQLQYSSSFLVLPATPPHHEASLLTIRGDFVITPVPGASPTVQSRSPILRHPCRCFSTDSPLWFPVMGLGHASSSARRHRIARPRALPRSRNDAIMTLYSHKIS